MEYITLEGDYLQAYHFCLENGGQLFCGNGKDSANVVLVGKQCYTFWKNGSKRLEEVKQLAAYFGLPLEGQTGGRIARWVLEELLQLPYKQTFWSKSYRALAKKGSHWHYLYCQERQYFNAVEIDIKGAYLSSLFTFPSLLYHPYLGYLQDNNALANLKILYPDMPKWFRLQILGCLSSWRVFYLTRDKSRLESKELITKQRHFIKYGAAFNCAHRAILRNYKVMKKLHEIASKYVRRIHTDSLLLDSAIPKEEKQLIFAYLRERKLDFSIKGYGRCYFWDVNTGFIGNKFVGASIEVTTLMRQDKLKMLGEKRNVELLQDFVSLPGSNPSVLEAANTALASRGGEYCQLDLFDTSFYHVEENCYGH